MHCRSPGGKLRGLAWRVSRPTPGEVSRPTPRGFPGPHLVGSPGTHLGGIPACTEADTPPPADSYCCGRYASYWNALTWVNYRLPIKLREGNIFSRFCHSIQGVPCDHYPWCMEPHFTGIPPAPAPCPLPPPRYSCHLPCLPNSYLLFSFNHSSLRGSRMQMVAPRTAICIQP